MGEEGVGARDRGDPRQPQLGHQPILEGLPQPLDAALGLGTEGIDGLDAQERKKVPDTI
jgi:hypothetical protein